MRRGWPFIAGVGLLGALAGLAIAGRPTAGDGFVVNATSITSVLTSVAPVATSQAPPETSVATTVPGTTASPTTAAPTTASPTTVPIAATTTTTTVPDRSSVRVVVANGAAVGGLAVDVASLLREAGYANVVATNATGTVPTSTVYYTPGFEREARQVAADLGLSTVAVEPLPDLAVSLRDDEGDVVAVLGIDARP